VQKFFDILSTGSFSPDRIRTEIVRDTMRRTEESEAFIERRWQDHLRTGFKPWPNDLESTRYRFVKSDKVGDELVVKVDPCVSYRDFIGAESFEFRDRFGHESLPRSLALTALVFARTESGEERMLITLRKPGHDYKAGGYHASIGGMMDSRKESDVVQSVLRELREESGLEEKDLEELTGRAVVMNLWTMHPDVIFKAVARWRKRTVVRPYDPSEHRRVDDRTYPRERRHHHGGPIPHRTPGDPPRPWRRRGRGLVPSNPQHPRLVQPRLRRSD
jgi:8-oxo-dGTP pyrophosphatase MutT (NUDIX family)